MAGLLRLSDAFSLAIHAMAFMGQADGDGPVSVARMAEAFGVSEAHLAKVLQGLARRGLLSSRRGARGGFVLARNPKDLTLLEIHDAVDGPLPCATCMLDRPMCVKGRCVMTKLFNQVYRQVRQELMGTRLADLVGALPKAVVESGLASVGRADT